MRLLTIFTLILFSARYISAQYIKITPNGFEYLQNKEKSYHIFNVEGKTGKELYNIIMKYIHKEYKNPAAVIKTNVENKYISVSEFSYFFSRVTDNSGNWIDLHAELMLSFEFKDNKIKFEIESCEMYYVDMLREIKVHFNDGFKNKLAVFNSNGGFQKKSMEVTASGIEKYFELKMNKIKNELKDDW